ncbi:hypothetical protein J3R82DRAFT_5415 [Butyriboletus roseoflavus]|nr:hypothetical protein J3R82DRAFT_5415 [Butyriboletus roseoflavus]
MNDHPLPSPSPSDSSSPPPGAVRVVCDVPLLAPRPLPYHSPTFLQFDLPDTDEDLSHPPYTHRPSKRKRDIHDEPQPQSKCRPGVHRRISRPRPWDHHRSRP